MYRDFITNKWVLGAIAFLIVFGIACIIWYHYDTVHYKQDAAKDEELLSQRETAQKTNFDDKIDNDTNKTLESSMPSTEKPKSETTNGISEENMTLNKTLSNTTKISQKMESVEDMYVSPYGFGPYPEVPEDYPSKQLIKWSSPSPSPRAELLSRVLIKLWTEGEKNFRGGCTNKGKIYPYFYNTVCASA